MIIEHSLKKSLDELIEESCESLRVPGMALMVAQGDDVIYEYFYGYRDVQAKKPVTQDTIFGVASLTKSFAALGIMQLEDAKKLSVDDPIVHWLPEFKTPGGQYLHDIKIHHLLSHSAGFPGLEAVNRARMNSQRNDPDGEYLTGSLALKAQGKPIKNVQELIEVMSEMDYEFLGAPGTVFNYSNESFAFLQEIIERASGKSFLTYMRENILEPLQMNRSVFLTEELKDFDNVTELYAYTKDQKDIFHSPAWWDVSDIYSNGSLKSTAANLMKYLKVYRQKAKDVISNKSVQKMMIPHMQMPTGPRYGYGLQINDYNGMKVVGHGGSIKGVSSHMKVIEEKDLSAVILVNLAGVPVEKILVNVLSRIAGFQSPYEQKIDTYSLKVEELEKYIGLYRTREGQSIEISIEEDELLFKDSSKRMVLRPFEKDHFISKDGQRIKFFSKDDGEISGLFVGLRHIQKDGR